MSMQCIMSSGFVADVMFSHNGANTDTGHWRIVYRDSPGGAGSEATIVSFGRCRLNMSVDIITCWAYLSIGVAGSFDRGCPVLLC